MIDEPKRKKTTEQQIKLLCDLIWFIACKSSISKDMLMSVRIKIQEILEP